MNIGMAIFKLRIKKFQHEWLAGVYIRGRYFIRTGAAAITGDKSVNF